MWVNFGTLRSIRNKLIIEHIYLTRATDAIYKRCGSMQLWKPLSKRRDRMGMDKLTRKYKKLASRLIIIAYPP